MKKWFTIRCYKRNVGILATKHPKLYIVGNI